MPNRNLTSPFPARSLAEHIQVDPSIVPLLVSEIVLDQYFHVALVATLVYHSLITLDKEVRYFWTNPRSSVSLIYFVNRCAGLLGVVCNIAVTGFKENITSCQVLAWILSLCNVITIVVIDYILLIRVLALYANDAKLSICLKGILTCEAGFGVGIIVWGFVTETILLVSLADGVTICASYKNSGKTLLIVSWIIPMVYGLVLLVLALYKATEYWRASSGLRGLDLVRVVIRDQLLYYGFVILCCLFKITQLFIEDGLVSVIIGALGSPTFLCILGGQLLINLKEAGERGVNGGTNYMPSKSVSDIAFA